MGMVGPEIRHILCGVDGSDPACRAAMHAGWLAKTLNAKLTFLAVARGARNDFELDAYRQTEGLGEEPVPMLPSQAEMCLVAALASASAIGHNTTDRLIRVGKVAQTLLSVAGEIGADTVVLGRHDRNELHRSFVGSVSRTIAAKSRLTLLQVW